jgi:hypothetical protein
MEPEITPAAAPAAEGDAFVEQRYTEQERLALRFWWESVAFPKLHKEFEGLVYGWADMCWTLMLKDQKTAMEIYVMRVAKKKGEFSLYNEPSPATLHRIRLLIRAIRAWNDGARNAPQTSSL